MTPREIFLELLKKDGKPERQLDQYEALNLVLYDPINIYLRGNRVRGSISRDKWGTVINFPQDAPGPIPMVDDETKVIKDIRNWRDYAVAPDLEANTREGWDECLKKAHAADPNHEKLLTGFMGTGIFEETHFLLPFTDSLSYLYEYPDEMHALIEYITEYRLEYVRLLIDGLHPEAILSHDDWGAKDSLFFSPDMWREFFKEPYERFYGYIRSRGVIAIHHADSYLKPILEDMVEMGIQVWQGALPENNIPECLELLDGRMVLMGGIGAAIDRPDSTEDEIRAYVRRTLRENCPHGHYIPCITYGVAGTVYPHVDPVIDDEIANYNAEYHFENHNVPELKRVFNRKVDSLKSAKPSASDASGAQAVTSEDSDVAGQTAEVEILTKISSALAKGQKKRVVSLTQEALDQGIPAEEVLSSGLVVGMTQVGDAFSQNKVFVPEMLMAARCMNAATAVLKPYLVSGGETESAGRVVIGTVKGDLHDIGKNLVKIMMEGNGLDVIDLGTDVSAEEFYEAAVAKGARLVACSALLTTSMPEMKKTVELIREKDPDKNIKILIGGAPISQNFCDEIGADCYTDDAPSAAKAAVELLK